MANATRRSELRTRGRRAMAERFSERRVMGELFTTLTEQPAARVRSCSSRQAPARQPVHEGTVPRKPAKRQPKQDASALCREPPLPPLVPRDEREGGRVLLTVFAGRRELMRPLLIPIVLRELRTGTLSEIHLWDYCKSPSDAAYVRSLTSVHHAVKVYKGGFRCSEAQLKKKLCRADCRDPTKCYCDWKLYYAHYASAANLRDHDVLLKVDDDVAFIHNLGALVRFVRERRPWGWVYPSIVNNDVMAHWQAHDGIWSFSARNLEVPALRSVWQRRGGTFCAKTQSRRDHPYTFTPRFDANQRPLRDPNAWFEDANTALHAIRHFLRAPPEAYARNITHAWTHNTRVSINLVCGAGRYVRAVFGKLGTSSKFPLPDEPWLSYSIPHELHATSYAVMATVAVHLHFGPQTAAVQNSTRLIRHLKGMVRRDKSAWNSTVSKVGSRPTCRVYPSFLCRMLFH